MNYEVVLFTDEEAAMPIRIFLDLSDYTEFDQKTVIEEMVREVFPNGNIVSFKETKRKI